MTSKMEFELIKMFKWAINKSFDNYPEETLNRRDLERAVRRAWDDMVQDGTIVIKNDTDA